MKEDQWLIAIGNDIKNFRLRKNLDQRTVAEEAGVALSALKNLEGGKGATLRTLLRVLNVLDRQTLIKVETVGKPLRQRASKKRSQKTAKTQAKMMNAQFGMENTETGVLISPLDGMKAANKESGQDSEFNNVDDVSRAKWIRNMLDICETDKL